MLGFIPHLKDRLGADSGRGTARSARCSTATEIPNTDSIVLISWMNCETIDFAAWDYLGGYFIRAGADEMFYLSGYSGSRDLRLNAKAGGVDQIERVYGHQKGKQCLVSVLDRDNTKLELWRDSSLIYQAGLTKDPDLTVDNRFFANSSGAVITTVSKLWRTVGIALKAGSVPIESEWAEILRNMQDPESFIHPELLERMGVDYEYSDYRLGEGLYGTTTVVDMGRNGDDMDWQGENVEDVRVRAPVPIATPDNTFFTLQPGYTANVAATDFELAVQPVVLRVLNGKLTSSLVARVAMLLNAGSTERFGIENVGGDDVRLRGRANGIYATDCILIGDQLVGGDIFGVGNGTVLRWYLNGQHIYTGTLNAAFDFTGDCAITMLKDGCARFAVWNPPVIPDTLEQEIRECCMVLEKDPISLKEFRKINFSLDVLHLTTPTSTDVDNDWGPGTLVISDDRDVACIPFAEGRDRLAA